ncbi:MAG: hypothetical protein GY757_60750 [bacterium]|nr:hypothetical protein [bacterium]
MTDLFAILMAITAYTCISTGFVLMKKGIAWIGWKEKRDLNYFKNLFLWIAGFIIMNIYGVPSAMALKQLPAYIVASFAGWGIIALVFLSYFILKEKIFPSDFIFSFAIVAGIFLLNFFEKPVLRAEVNIVGVMVLSTIPVVLFVLGFSRSLPGKVKTVVFASVSGISAGLMVVALRVLVLNYQYKILLYFRSPYLYLYIFFALLSFVALQVALKKGAMMIIGPVQYSSNIIYPLLASLLVFDRTIHFIQFPAIGVIVFSVSAILRKH